MDIVNENYSRLLGIIRDLIRRISWNAYLPLYYKKYILKFLIVLEEKYLSEKSMYMIDKMRNPYKYKSSAIKLYAILDIINSAEYNLGFLSKDDVECIKIFIIGLIYNIEVIV